MTPSTIVNTPSPPPSMPFLVIVPTNAAVAVIHGRNDPRTASAPAVTMIAPPKLIGVATAVSRVGGAV